MDLLLFCKDPSIMLSLFSLLFSGAFSTTRVVSFSSLMMASSAANGEGAIAVICVCCSDVLGENREYYALVDPNIERRLVCGHQLCGDCFSKAVVHKDVPLSFVV